MELTESTWVWVACLGGAGGAVSAWLARQGGLAGPGRAGALGRLSHIAVAATIAAGTAAATAWMIGGPSEPPLWVGPRAVPESLAFFWIGFVTVGWIDAERDKRLLRRAVCSAATAPAAHPDTVQELAHASPDAIYEAVKALVPRRVVR
ncbi:MAG: hypothetical protein R2708_05030 [Vicinamibacterales bacterium]